MTELARTVPAGQIMTRGPGRPLGLRVEPALRLAMGYRDEQRRGAPVKTDYFIAKLGKDGANRRAADKFHQVYGDKPRQIDILLPSELGQALNIRHKAWGSSGDDDGGVLKAVGQTNFALTGTLGGPDILTVWNPDGSVDEVAITGVDDPAARELGVDLYTTFRFGIPSVLGASNFAEITSKGIKTTDNLFAKLAELYQLFGMRVSFVVRPKLVLRPATGRPVVQTKDGPRRIKSQFFALDIVVPESFEEMFTRLQERAAFLPGGSASLALYGPQALPAADQASPATAPAAAPVWASDTGGGEQAGGGAEHDFSPDAAAGSSPDDYDGDAVDIDEATQAVVPKGPAKGKTLAEVVSEPGARTFLEWALSRPDGYWDDGFLAALTAVAEATLPFLLGAEDDPS